MVTTAYRITVRGTVQGVGFRFNARNEAIELGLNGYVKNLDDGSVEIVVSGDSDVIDTFVKWCYLGPDSAKVDTVDVQVIGIKDEFTDFRIQ